MVSVNEKVGDFVLDSVVGGRRERIGLSHYRGKYLLIFFYPVNFTFASAHHISSVDDVSQELQELNSEVIGISGEHVQCLASFQKSFLGQTEVRFVSDPFKQIQDYFGVSAEGMTHGGSVLAVIDPKGRLLSMETCHSQIGFDMKEVLRKLKESLKCPECGGKIIEEVIRGEKTRQYCEDCQLLRI